MGSPTSPKPLGQDSLGLRLHYSFLSQVSDNLKVSFLLPKLRKVNGKDASSTCAQVENLNRELTNRVKAVRRSVSGRAWEQRGALRE